MLPVARPTFETVTHLAWGWALVFVLGLLPVTVIEVWKLVTAALR
jgi:hypothetical protein